MNKILMTVIKLLVAILPIVILCLASRKNNLPKPERTKQFPMPIIAIVYVIIAMLLMNTLSEWLLNLIGGLPAKIMSLISIFGVVGKLASGLTGIGNTLTSLLSSLNLNLWVFFIANIVIMVVYLIVKRISIKIIRKR